jgi:hypothetical protein
MFKISYIVRFMIFVPPHLEREVRFRDSVSGGGVHIKVSAHFNKARTTHAHQKS